MLNKTSGDISITGYNYEKNNKEIKKLLGFCS